MTTTTRRCFVTGANRGLGLEFTRQLVARGDFVVAACRIPEQADGLRSVVEDGRGSTIALDVTDPASIAAAAERVACELDAIELLINAAGVGDSARSSGPLPNLDGEAIMAVFRVNTIGPALVTKAFAPLLARGAGGLVLNLASRMGLIEHPIVPGNIGYGLSKAALNLLTAKLAAELRSASTTVVAISPGWVKTDMGGADAPLSPEDSVSMMLRVADTLTPAQSGAVLTHEGDWLVASPRGSGRAESSIRGRKQPAHQHRLAKGS